VPRLYASTMPSCYPTPGGGCSRLRGTRWRRSNRPSQRHRRRHSASEFRPWGIDAPESDQLCRRDDSPPYRCSAKAVNDLADFIGGRQVSCKSVTADRYGRTV
jgi:endonuclease YncB( thermonuclease family)